MSEVGHPAGKAKERVAMSEERVIKGTRRPDGTYRKDIKVRESSKAFRSEELDREAKKFVSAADKVVHKPGHSLLTVS